MGSSQSQVAVTELAHRILDHCSEGVCVQVFDERRERFPYAFFRRVFLGWEGLHFHAPHSVVVGLTVAVFPRPRPRPPARGTFQMEPCCQRFRDFGIVQVASWTMTETIIVVFCGVVGTASFSISY
jgi:hypothetical protein